MSAFTLLFLTSIFVQSFKPQPSNVKIKIPKVEIQEFQTSYGEMQNINGYEPTDPSELYPLFIWLASTFALEWNADAQIYTNYTAPHNVVAASVSYRNNLYPQNCDQMISKAATIFNTSDPTAAISVLCAKDNVNCDKGVIVAGYSQGAQLTALSANFGADSMIKGIYQMAAGDDNLRWNVDFTDCLSYDKLEIDNTRIRAFIGENDTFFGTDVDAIIQQQIAITGYDRDQCVNTDSLNCLQQDKSGWYIVNGEEAEKEANHCYAFEGLIGPLNCAGDFTSVYYRGCQLECVWSLESNIEWLINKLAEDNK
eukprot:323510_1